MIRIIVMIKKIFKVFIRLTLSLLLVISLIILWLRITEWQPQDVETTYTNPTTEVAILPDTITVVSWNIGYAGLGADMDFFYDGGTQTRTSERQTNENLNAIIGWLKDSEADIIMLQEVDFGSKRSYYIDQYNVITEGLNGYTSVYAWNYVSTFVPLPIENPMGKVVSGLVTLSKFPVAKSQRYSYPSKFDFPVRLFNLKRCMLSTYMVYMQGDTIIFNNTHNTAFDTGTMREEEFVFMNEHIKNEQTSFTAGDWNSTPPGYTASKAELENEFFSPIAIKKGQFSEGFTFAADVNPNNPTARYNYEPYKKGVTTTTILDFGIATPGIEVISTQTVDLGFINSDHNPVIYKIVIAK